MTGDTGAPADSRHKLVTTDADTATQVARKEHTHSLNGESAISCCRSAGSAESHIADATSASGKLRAQSVCLSAWRSIKLLASAALSEVRDWDSPVHTNLATDFEEALPCEETISIEVIAGALSARAIDTAHRVDDRRCSETVLSASPPTVSTAESVALPGTLTRPSDTVPDSSAQSRCRFVQSFSTDSAFADAEADRLCQAGDQNGLDTSPASEASVQLLLTLGTQSLNDFPDETLQKLAPETVCAAYQAEGRRLGLSKEEVDALLKEVTDQVLPRNLSDTSQESAILAAARKLYVWQEPLPVSPVSSTLSMESGMPGDDVSLVGVPGDLLSKFESICLDTDNISASPGDRKVSTSSCSSSATADSLLSSSSRAINHEALDSRPLSTLLPAQLASGITSPGHSDANGSPVQLGQASRFHMEDHKRQPANQIVQLHSAALGASLPTKKPDGPKASPAYQQNEHDYYKPKRSSSLKSTRTPPNSPSRKAVRFADTFGLDLATVKTVFDHDVPPRIPASAMTDLRLDSNTSLSSIGSKHYRICFAQPGASANFRNRVISQKVCLESAEIDAGRTMLIGSVMVKNVCFEKRVLIRMTSNNWITHWDTPATYVLGSHDGQTDRFSFSVVLSNRMVSGGDVQLAASFQTNTGEQFWDNNFGQNYRIVCFAKQTDLAGDGSWMNFL